MLRRERNNKSFSSPFAAVVGDGGGELTATLVEIRICSQERPPLAHTTGSCSSQALHVD